MKHHSKTQAPVSAKRDAACLADDLGQAIELAAENLGYVFAWVRPATDGDGVGGVSFRGGLVRCEF